MPLLQPRVLFLTGATGFIGRAVLERMRSSRVSEIVCLVRHDQRESPTPEGTPRVTYVRGDLDDPGSYAAALARADSILHMAAAVGSASDSALERVNVIGTKRLCEAAKNAGVRQLIFMSSIAAKTPDVSHYPYARTKVAAEGYVAQSGLDYAILRPTIVLGVSGGNWPMLRKLANLPVIPVFGGGRALVQPVDVADVAHAVALTLSGHAGTDQVIEVGGPETLSFTKLLLAIRLASGRASTAVVSIPYVPARTALALLARLSGGRFPVRAGQLTPFVADGVAAPNAVLAELLPTMAPLAALLERLVRAD